MNRHVTILALGDSLTEGFGIPPDAAFPHVLQNLLLNRGHNTTCVNLGLSGDTTWGGLHRLQRYLANHPTPDAAIVELGANDGIMQLPISEVEDNLRQIMTVLQQEGIPILFTGMKALFTEDTEYAKEFDAIYTRIRNEFSCVYYPFFLEGVFGDPSLNLWDEIHPNIEGTAKIATSILPYVEEILGQIYQAI